MKITLCGSAKFEEEYLYWNEKLTMVGHLVYTLAVMPSQKETREWYVAQEKEMLDLVHLAKIEESDVVVVINCTLADWAIEDYIGESTKREILWARLRGRPCFYTKTIRGDTEIMLKMLEAYAWKGIVGHENI